MDREERYVSYVIKPNAKPVLATVSPPDVHEFDLPPHTTEVIHDLKWLDPTFRERVEIMLASLRKEGYEPLVWETLRTPERGRYLQQKGASKNGDKSMHIHTCACDIICSKHKWQCKKNNCDFFQALGKAVKAHKLYWGGDWKTIVDLPHLQAVPVNLQNAIRACKGNKEEIAKIVKKAIKDL